MRAVDFGGRFRNHQLVAGLGSLHCGYLWIVDEVRRRLREP